MEDKTLLQALIKEIKDLNARGVSDSKILRDSLAQEALVSQEIKDLNKQFEKSSKDSLLASEESNGLLEEIRDAVKSGTSNSGSVGTASSLLSLTTLFYKMIDGTKDLVDINTKLNKNIGALQASTDAMGAKLSRFFNMRATGPVAPAPRVVQTSQAATSNSAALVSQTKIDEYQKASNTLGSFFDAINRFKILPAFKASVFMPLIVNNLVKAMKKFDQADVFGKMRITSQKTKIGKKTVDETFDYSASIFESIQKLADGIGVIQNLKMAKTWVNVKLLSLFIIPNLVKGISKFDKVKESTTRKLGKIGESIASLLKPISELMSSFLKMGLGLIAIAGGVAAMAGAMYLISKLDTDQIIKGGSVILGFLASLALASKFTKSSVATSASMIMLGAAMIPFAFGLSLLQDLKWEQIAAGGGAMVAMMGALALVGKLVANPAVALGILATAAAIGIIGLAFIPLSESLKTLSNIDPMGLLSLSTALITFTASLAPLILAAPLVAMLSGGMAVLTLSLFALSKIGLKMQGVNDFFNRFTNFVSNSEISKIWGLSAAIGGLSLALTAFSAAGIASSAGGIVSGLLDFFNFNGDSPISQLKELAQLTNLATIGAGVKDLAEGMTAIAAIGSGSFAAFNSFPWEKLKEVAKELEAGSPLQIIPISSANALNGQTLEKTGSTMTNQAPVIITNVTNSGGNVMNNNVSSSNRNIRVAPSLESGSALAY